MLFPEGAVSAHSGVLGQMLFLEVDVQCYFRRTGSSLNSGRRDRAHGQSFIQFFSIVNLFQICHMSGPNRSLGFLNRFVLRCVCDFETGTLLLTIQYSS